MSEPRSPRTEAGKLTMACDHPTSARVFDSMGWSCSRCEQFIEADDPGNPPEAEAAAPRSGEDEAYRRGFTDGRGEPPERGTVTQCPLEGVHEHVFRGPHSFREWLGASREASEPKFEMVHAGSWTREYLRRKAAPREASEPPST